MKSKQIKERIVTALRDRDIKLTAQRMAIIDILASDGSHPSAGALLAKARERMPAISASTVYYALALLKREGLIKELEFYDMENRYESEMTDHVDLICTMCGKIENLIADLPVSPEIVKDSTGFEAERMRFEFYGLCRRCKEKK